MVGGVDEMIFDPLYDIRNNVPTFKAIQESVRDRRPPGITLSIPDTSAR